MDLRLSRNQLRHDAPETKCVLTESRSHPVLAGGGRVALIEDEVDDFEHRRQPGFDLVSARDLEGHARLGEDPLGPDDSLGDRGLGDEECPCDLPGRQPSEQA